MNLFRSLIILSSALAFAVAPSAAQSNTDTSTPSSTSSPSGSSSSTPSPSSSLSFGNITTTNSQGSTIVTSIPITIPLNTSSTSTSTAPFPSLTGYPPCVVNCLTYAVSQVNCSSITAVNCYCPSQLFPDSLYSCVLGNCSTNVPSAENLAKQFCAVDNVTLSFSVTTAPSTATSPSASSPTSTTPLSSATFNAASVVSWSPDTRGWITMVVAACGALFGAALL